MAIRSTFVLRSLAGMCILIVATAGYALLSHNGGERAAHAEEAADSVRVTTLAPGETPRMNTTTQTGAAPGIPAIDRAVPKKVETATFALG
jgi:hypothetical protein